MKEEKNEPFGYRSNGMQNLNSRSIYERNLFDHLLCGHYCVRKSPVVPTGIPENKSKNRSTFKYLNYLTTSILVMFCLSSTINTVIQNAKSY